MKLTATIHQPAGSKSARAESVGVKPGDRPGDEERDRERKQIDPGPQRRPLKAVSMQRKPDALKPDDEHELQPASAHRREQPSKSFRSRRP